MVYCLHPKKPHLNDDGHQGNAPTQVPRSSGSRGVIVSEQVTCRYCKYLLEGALLGDCRVMRWIGSGAFGDVYEAQQLPPLSRRVAVKVMSLEHLADDAFAHAFIREANAIASLDHPNILPVLRAGLLDDGRSYLVMKYAAHGSLQKHCQLTPQGLSIMPAVLSIRLEIDEQGADGEQDAMDDLDTRAQIDEPSEPGEPVTPPRVSTSAVLTPQQLLPYLEDAAAALQYAHDHSVIHLDVKPANLLLDGEDRLMLADFGVSTILDGYTHASLHCYVGTPVYTAPEQWLEQPRQASDQYALAITCYQLLVGRLPFTGNLYSIMHGHLQLPPPRLSELNPLIPEQVEAVILRALAKEPTGRYKDMRSFARAYREAVVYVAADTTDALSRRQPATTRELDNPPVEQPALIISEQTAFARGERKPVPQKFRSRWWRVGVLVLLALLLVGGGTIGAVRIFNPCLMGICSGLKLSTTEVDVTNTGTQVVKITNTGTTDQQWSVTNAVSGNRWLSYAPASGTLAAGNTANLSITTNVDGLSNGVDIAQLEVNGLGVPSMPLVVKLTVQAGLSLITATATASHFVYDQAGAHPAFQTITITNTSDQSFSWFLSYKNINNWLQITPSSDTLAAGGTESLLVTVNALGLPSDTYVTDFSVLGSLGQSDPALLSSFEFTLEVKIPAQAVSPVADATPTLTSTASAFSSLAFTAQSPTTTNTPLTLRSGHSMVWDSQDDLLFLFGGIDSQGNYLNDLWSYSPLTSQWAQITGAATVAGTCAGGNWPAPRMDAAMVWDSVNNQILLYGGVGAHSRYFGDLWSYSPSSGAGNWTPLACNAAGPGARTSNAVWDGSQMLLLGGINHFGLLADFWSYTPASNDNPGSWQRLTDFPGGQRAYQTLVWDSTDSQLFVFGGLDVTGAQRNDFYAYTSSGGWNAIIPASASASYPKQRQQGIGVWDSKDRVMLLMGGWNDKDVGAPYYGLWAYDPTSNTWSLLTPLNSQSNNIIPGRTASTMVWDAREHAAYIYAGAGSSKTGSTLDDLWMVTSG